MKKNIYYSNEMKLIVIRQVVSGEISMHEAQKRYNIGGNCTISRWISKFTSQNNPFDLQKYQEMAELPQISVNSVEEIDKLRAKIKQLESELEYEKIRSEAFATMIKIAEQQYKIPIKKKFGAKPSKSSKKSGQDLV